MSSTTHLTYFTDKLIAIYGLASEFKRELLAGDDVYLAGMWKSFLRLLPFALLWIVRVLPVAS
jgi:hypothetical protein